MALFLAYQSIMSTIPLVILDIALRCLLFTKLATIALMFVITPLLLILSSRFLRPFGNQHVAFWREGRRVSCLQYSLINGIDLPKDFGIGLVILKRQRMESLVCVGMAKIEPGRMTMVSFLIGVTAV